MSLFRFVAVVIVLFVAVVPCVVLSYHVVLLTLSFPCFVFSNNLVDDTSICGNIELTHIYFRSLVLVWKKDAFNDEY
jgi:hypothetical protein